MFLGVIGARAAHTVVWRFGALSFGAELKELSQSRCWQGALFLSVNVRRGLAMRSSDAMTCVHANFLPHYTSGCFQMGHELNLFSRGEMNLRIHADGFSVLGLGLARSQPAA